ncbi:MAG TPA: PspC domain-containing protein [Allosphingosinicella sp.]|jgi:phage shock protein PspC (stress-responsive transcriptional regulator)
MQASQPSLIARDDTFLGICAALGEDFGFNPQYLRAALGVLLFVNPVAVLGGYAAAGVVVLISRLLAPNPRIAAVEEPAAAAPAAAAVEAAPEPIEELDLEPEPLAVAA